MAAVAAETERKLPTPNNQLPKRRSGLKVRSYVIVPLPARYKVTFVDAAHEFNVLFLCTGNSARSIMAEALLNHFGKGRFRAFSAGSHPRGAVHPLALDTLARNHLSIDGLRSKSWEEFAQPNAPRLDFVFTVCDRAAQEMCPVWPGQPMTAHWGIEDPATIEGTIEQQQRAFNAAFRALDARLRLFTSLRLESLHGLALQQQLDAIGRIRAGD